MNLISCSVPQIYLNDTDNEMASDSRLKTSTRIDNPSGVSLQMLNGAAEFLLGPSRALLHASLVIKSGLNCHEQGA